MYGTLWSWIGIGVLTDIQHAISSTKLPSVIVSRSLYRSRKLSLHFTLTVADVKCSIHIPHVTTLAEASGDKVARVDRPGACDYKVRTITARTSEANTRCFVASWGGNHRSSCSTIARENLVRHATVAETVEEAQAVLLGAAEKRDQEPDDVIGAIRQALQLPTSRGTLYRCARPCGTTAPYYRT